MFKYTLITAFLLSFLLFSCESDEVKSEEVPENIKSAFNAQYAEAENAEWEKDGENWEVEFSLQGVEMEAEYSATGQWIETEMDMNLDDVPANVMSVFMEAYPETEAKEADKVIREEFMAYEIEFEQDGEEMEVLITDQGEIVEVNKDTDDD